MKQQTLKICRVYYYLDKPLKFCQKETEKRTVATLSDERTRTCSKNYNYCGHKEKLTFYNHVDCTDEYISL